MTDYAAVRANWWRLLRWHLKENGTRPNGHPDVPGEPWDDAEFALACNTGNANDPRNAGRTVQNWYNERSAIVTPKRKAIEQALMGSKDHAYDPWRRDLRAAHTAARQEKRSALTTASPVNAIADPSRLSNEPRDSKIFDSILRQGFLLRLNRTIYITPDFLSSIWRRCSSPHFISKMTSPDQDMPEATRLTNLFLARITITAVERRPWDLDELTLVNNETNFYLHQIFCKKAQEVGLFSIADSGIFVIDHDAYNAFIHNWLARLSHNSSRSDFYRQAYEAWKFISRAAIENGPEKDLRYVEILALLMFATFYDSGSLERVTQELVDDLDN